MKLPGIAQIFKDSVVSPAFYRGLRERPLWFSLKYYIVLSLALALAATIAHSAFGVPRIVHFVRDLAPVLLAEVPDDLVLTIKGGEAMLDREGAYLMPFPDAWRKELGGEASEDVPRNVLAIDTRETFSVERFREYDAIFLVTKDQFVAGTPDSFRVRNIPNAFSAVITKQTASDFLKTIKDDYLKWVIVFFVVSLYGGTLLFYGLELGYLLLAALLIWAIYKIKHVPAGYGLAYRTAIHASSVSLALYTLWLMVPGAGAARFLFTIITAMVAWMNIRPETVNSK